MEELTLDAFVDEAAGGPADGVGGEVAGDADGEVGAEPADTALETAYSWTPDGAGCAACGGIVGGPWRDAGRWVCGECVAW